MDIYKALKITPENIDFVAQMVGVPVDALRPHVGKYAMSYGAWDSPWRFREPDVFNKLFRFVDTESTTHFSEVVPLGEV
jgi:hypothetical protein